MKELLLLCTKNVHFTFNNEICQQCDGAAMRSTLGLVIAGIFMVELEKPLTPTLLEHMSPWKQYVDDAIGVRKLSSIEHVLSILNSFHQNIEFTYELERNGKINFNFFLERMTPCKLLYIEKVPIMGCIFTGTLLRQELGNVVNFGQF